MSLSIMSRNESMDYQDAGVISRMIGYAKRASKNAVKLLTSSPS
jgi:hypothetical protein